MKAILWGVCVMATIVTLTSAVYYESGKSGFKAKCESDGDCDVGYKCMAAGFGKANENAPKRCYQAGYRPH